MARATARARVEARMERPVVAWEHQAPAVRPEQARRRERPALTEPLAKAAARVIRVRRLRLRQAQEVREVRRRVDAVRVAAALDLRAEEPALAEVRAVREQAAVPVLKTEPVLRHRCATSRLDLGSRPRVSIGRSRVMRSVPPRGSGWGSSRG